MARKFLWSGIISAERLIDNNDFEWFYTFSFVDYDIDDHAVVSDYSVFQYTHRAEEAYSAHCYDNLIGRTFKNDNTDASLRLSNNVFINYNGDDGWAYDCYKNVIDNLSTNNTFLNGAGSGRIMV